MKCEGKMLPLDQTSCMRVWRRKERWIGGCPWMYSQYINNTKHLSWTTNIITNCDNQYINNILSNYSTSSYYTHNIIILIDRWNNMHIYFCRLSHQYYHIQNHEKCARCKFYLVLWDKLSFVLYVEITS